MLDPGPSLPAAGQVQRPIDGPPVHGEVGMRWLLIGGVAYVALVLITLNMIGVWDIVRYRLRKRRLDRCMKSC
jgi:hypothetical protein